MATDSDTESSFLEQLISSRNRDLSLLLPLILGFSNSRRRTTSDGEEQEHHHPSSDRIILINPFTQGMIVIESSRSLEAILREISDKDGLPPASKSSIESMPKVEITEAGECSICLEGWDVGSEASEMPCKHKYHSKCIEKWLGIHGSCPVCRFEMPVDDDDDKLKKRNDDEEEEVERSFEREVWVSFSFNRTRSSTTTSNQTTTTEDSDDGSSSAASTNEEEEEEN